MTSSCMHIIKMSNSMKLVPRTKEWCEKIGKAHKGKIITKEHRDKISIGNSGKTCPEHVKEIDQ